MTVLRYPRRGPCRGTLVALVGALIVRLLLVATPVAIAAPPEVRRPVHGEPLFRERLQSQFDRISRATGLTIFAVDGQFRGCIPWTSRIGVMVDCHPIIWEVQAPSVAWSDSLVAMLTTPGALAPPSGTVMGQCEDDILLRFTSATETTQVWLVTGCGIANFPQASPPVTAYYSDGGLKEKIYSLMPSHGHESRHYLEYYDGAPVRIDRTNGEPKPLMEPSSPADTVWFDAWIGKNGRIELLVLKRSVAGLDSLAAATAMEYRFRPATSAGRPVISVQRLGVPVHRR